MRITLTAPHLLALRLLVWLGGRVPARTLDAAAGLLGTLAWYASPDVRAVTRDHMRQDRKSTRLNSSH